MMKKDNKVKFGLGLFLIFACFGTAFGFSLGYLLQGRQIVHACNAKLERVQNNNGLYNFDMVPNNQESAGLVVNRWTGESYNVTSGVYCKSKDVCYSMRVKDLPESLKSTVKRVEG